MTDKQCPVCGEQNPENEINCWKCGSSLDPQDSLNLNQEEHQNPEELADILRKFDLEAEANDEIERTSGSVTGDDAFSAEEDAFWLERMRELSLGDTEESKDFDEPGEMDISDENIPPWLKAVDPTRKQEPAAEPDDEWSDLQFDVGSRETPSFTIQATSGQEEKPAEISDDLSDDELPDWLMRLRRSHSASTEEDEPEQEETAPPTEERDWLHDLMGPQEQVVETPEEEASQEVTEIPEEFQVVGEETEQEKDEEDEAFIFSFFKEPGDSEAGQEEEATAEEIGSHLEDEEFSEALTSAKTEEVAFSEEESLEDVEQVQEETQPEEEMLDWLVEEQPVVPMTETEITPGIDTEIAEAQEEDSLEFSLTPEEQGQDWSQVVENLDESESSIEDELPGWMSLQDEIIGEEAEPPDGQPQESEFTVGEGDQEPAIEQEPAFEESTDSNFTQSESAEVTAEQDVREEDQQVSAEAPAEEEDGKAPFRDKDLLAWMHDLRAEELQKEEAEEDAAKRRASAKEGIPDWFEEESTPGEETLEKEEVLEHGDLPTWLSAIRPIEAVIPEDIKQLEEKKVEQVGPLAGLHAVLQVEEDAAYYAKPPVYSVQLQVSEKQRAHAAMLEDILDAEGQVPVEKRKRKATSQVILRLFVALVILAAAVLPYFDISAGKVPLVTGASSGVHAFSTAVDSIPQGGTVLVGVDFAPGYSGEMNVVASGVFARLVSRGIHIAVISTTPTGPALAEGLIDQTLSKLPDYAAQYSQSDWYINLGYLPGETASLKEFAQNPRQAVIYGMKAGLSNALVWDSAGLANIQQVSDFSSVILLTDSLENGRAWIEQVQPSMNNVPLLAASSAQAAPLLQPYVQSDQIQAILAGMPEGLAYGQQVLSAGNTDLTYRSYQNVVLLSILILLVGGLIAGIVTMFTNSKSGQEV
jgi:hypothetical protein